MQSLSILIIDDDEDGRFTFRRHLKKMPGYVLQIAEAETGLEGIDLFCASQPDIVLLDYSLPGMAGDEVLKKLKDLKPDVPVVMMSGHGNEDVATKLMKQGASDFLPKNSITADVLHSVVCRAINQPLKP